MCACVCVCMCVCARGHVVECVVVGIPAEYMDITHYEICTYDSFCE